jgi:polyisoprenoid-binding protein YceI
MFKAIRCFTLAAAVAMCGTMAGAAETYSVDPVHSSVSFMTPHAGISYIHGRFNDFSGTFTLDKEHPGQSSFALSINVASVDTNNQKRDEHLRAPDYFNEKQFPAITFQSTQVKKTDGGLEVTGNLTLHGVTKPITMTLKGGDKIVEFPKGTPRVGVQTMLTIDRTEFGMTTAFEGLGKEVHINIALEAAKK